MRKEVRPKCTLHNSHNANGSIFSTSYVSYKLIPVHVLMVGLIAGPVPTMDTIKYPLHPQFMSTIPFAEIALFTPWTVYNYTRERLARPRIQINRPTKPEHKRWTPHVYRHVIIFFSVLNVICNNWKFY